MNDIQQKRAEDLVANMPNPPRIVAGAYFREYDRIVMPDYVADDEAWKYYAVLLHEAIHATGHPSRLNRLVSTEEQIFGSRAVSNGMVDLVEELTAEIGSCLLAATIHIVHLTQPRQEDFIRTYVGQLRNDGLLKKAITQAQEACEYILQRKVSLGILPYRIKKLLGIV